MKHCFMVIFALFFCAWSGLSAQTSGKINFPKTTSAEIEHLLTPSTMGRDFWVAIPPNDLSVGGGRRQSLEIYVTAKKNTVVTLEVPWSGAKISKKVDSMQITTFTTLDNSLNWEYELDEAQESEKVTNKGIHLYSDDEFAVNMMSNREFTSDGYMALPTKVLGTDYFHVGYYDFRYTGGGGGGGGGTSPWAGGFLIVATEDNTGVTITLKGKGTASTKGGKKLGAVINVNLSKGQTYMVRGDATTRGSFDLTGSSVVASRPVGFVSFHMRTQIPSTGIINGSDHLCEMLPPVSAWGKQYVTVELPRKNKGDFFRVIASQPKTTFSMKYYDKATGSLIAQRGALLQNAGDFAEYEEVDANNSSHSSVRGVSIWEADKPIFVMQYSYSYSWDNTTGYDPFMICVPSTQQFTQQTIFQTPSNKQYTNNFVTIMAVGNPNDPEQKLLKTVELNGEEIWRTNPKFLIQRIPTTNLYWANVKVLPQAHKIQAQTPFGAYMYGIDDNSYGWLAASSMNKIDQLDTLPPVLTRTLNCGNYDYDVEEKRNGDAGDANPQVDQGVRDIEIIPEVSSNYRVKLITMNPIKPGVALTEFKFRLELVDRRKNAHAVVAVTDRAGNTTFDSVWYQTDVVSMDVDSLSIGKIRVGTTGEITTALLNPTDSVMTVKSLRLKNNSLFHISQGAAPPEYTIPAKGSKDIKFTYTPTAEGKYETSVDRDSIFASSICGEFVLGSVTGRGVVPHIEVGNFDAGSVLSGNKSCADVSGSEILLIKNVGTDKLTVTGVSGLVAPFTISDPTTPKFPFVVNPGEQVYLKEICYKPTTAGEHKINVTIQSDAPKEDDNIGELRGFCQVVGVEESKFVGYHLSQNVPNPAENSTEIDFSIGGISNVRLTLCTIMGEEIKTLINDTRNAGTYRVHLNTEDLSAGVYYYRLTAGGFTAIQKMVVTK